MAPADAMKSGTSETYGSAAGCPFLPQTSLMTEARWQAITFSWHATSTARLGSIVTVQASMETRILLA